MLALFPTILLSAALLLPTTTIAPQAATPALVNAAVLPTSGSGGTVAGAVLLPTIAVQGLPQRAPEPRTLHAFWPVFAGFVLTWIGIVAYLLSFAPRMRRLSEALERQGRDPNR